MLTRRNFLKTGLTSGAALPLASSLQAFDGVPADLSEPLVANASPRLEALPTRTPESIPGSQSWQKHVRRVGQTNMTEHDPAVMDIDAWADYWHSAQVDVVFISVTGILAFYPSKVPFHRHGKFLNGRDFFGECVARRKETRHARGGAHESRSELAGRRWPRIPNGQCATRTDSVQHSAEEPRLFKTCMFSTYMDDYVPAIMREINSLYDVDCFYTNGWPPLGSLPECHCAVCRKLARLRDAGILASVHRASAGAVAEVRCYRQREEARQLLLRELGRQRPRGTESGSHR